MRPIFKHLLHQPAPQWPDTRDIDRYNELTGHDIPDELINGGIWIDVGAGKRAEAMSAVKGRKNIKCVAVAAHEMTPPPEIESLFVRIPNSMHLLDCYSESSALVTDIYGAVSYADDPLEVLIYEAMLLKKEGKCLIYTDWMRFGPPITWNRIAHFFLEALNREISFTTFETVADSDGTLKTGLRICIKGGEPLEEWCFADLVEKAKQHLGFPFINRVLWRSPDGLAEIRQVDYN